MARAGMWLLVALAGWLWLAPAARAEIYVYRDGKGALHFSNAPSSAAYRPYAPSAAVLSTGRRFYRMPAKRRRDFDPMISEIAGRYQVDRALVKAVIHAESNFVPYAQSPKGALGLMQLMPGTARMHKVSRVFDPRENIRGGVKHLRLLLDRYSGNVRKALAAYNAGEDAVDRYGGVPPYGETVEYLQRVLYYREQYLRDP